MATTPRMGYDLIGLGAANADVLYTRKLMRDDLTVCGVVKSRTTSAQPSGVEGNAYILPSGATGASWGTFTAGNIAVYQAGAWVQYTPSIGWHMWVEDEQIMVRYLPSVWRSITGECVFAAHYSAGGQAVDGTVRYIPWDTSDKKPTNGIYTHSTVTNNTDITLVEAGDYHLSVNATFNHTAGAVNSRCDVIANVGGADIAYGFSYVFGNSGAQDKVTAALDILLTGVTANSVLKIKAVRGSGTGTISLLANGSRIVVRKVA